MAIPTFEDDGPLVQLVVACGYEYRGENGIPRRHHFVTGAPRRTHHLHVLERHSAEWRRHVAFRDALLESPSAAAAYSRLKRAIVARSGRDREVHQDLKAAFITRHLVSSSGAWWHADALAHRTTEELRFPPYPRPTGMTAGATWPAQPDPALR